MWQKLKGFNLGTVEIPPKGFEDYRTFTATGAKLLRLVIPTYQNQSPVDYWLTPLQWSFLETTVSLARRWGFKVVVGLAPQPSALQAQYWKDHRQQIGISRLWSQIAEHFKGDEAIAGFDLINEPVAPTAQAWADFAHLLLNAVRAQDIERTVIIESHQWAHPQAFANEVRVPGDNVIYSLHFYDPIQLTHQGVLPGCVRGNSYPTKIFNRDYLIEQLRPAVEFAKSQNVPMYVGEFSCVRWAPGESRQQWISDAVSLFEEQGWAWTFHAWRGFDGWIPQIPDGLPAELPQTYYDYLTENSEAMQVLAPLLR